MTILGNIFKLFSRRQSPDPPKVKSLTPEFKNRYLMFYRDIMHGGLPDCLLELHNKLTYLHGTTRLSNVAERHDNLQDDVLHFLNTCSDEHFLDVVELMFQLKSARFVETREDDVVDQINEFLSLDELPYSVTKSVWEEGISKCMGGEYPCTTLRCHPQVIRKDSEPVHQLAVEPALTLLRKPDLLNANEEYLSALQDFRKHNYRDCVVKSCSALESVMKVLCIRQGLAYSDTDTAAPLLRTLISNTSLDSFGEQPIMLIATIRNRLGTAHGAGDKTKEVPEHIALYSINSCVAAILLLCDETY